MIDRVFGVLALLVVLGYGVIAFTLIKAPFQYDPLGPESWPRILSVTAALSILVLLAKPDSFELGIAGKTWLRIAIVLVLLFVYAAVYQSLGFIVATSIFACLMALFLGADGLKAIVFGVVSGVVLYLVCARMLELNLPAGVLAIF